MTTPSRWLCKRWSRGPAFVLAAILLGAVLAATPASAATPSGSTTSSASDSCFPYFYHTAGSRTDKFMCGTRIHRVYWPDTGAFPFNGRYEEFGVGTDGIVYHAWQEYNNDEDWAGCLRALRCCTIFPPDP